MRITKQNKIMNGFLEKNFIGLLTTCIVESFGRSLVLADHLAGPIKRVSSNNRPCQARSTLVDISLNKTLFYPFTVSVNRCCGSCNAIDDLYTRVSKKYGCKII